ncbi:DegT/DnrJ/EryC1/StrS family aminotransferase [candidate division KSB1 bacterium]|nr:MAG: DegT/DnrJ/EryC1/StrS family aminotransferase [candidate division KSB1 bacterium]
MGKKLAIKGGERVVPAGMIKKWPWITEEDKKAILEALDRGILWGVNAPNVKALEEGWAEYVGTKYCLTANSGTAALHMAVAAVGIEPGDEVITSAYTFLASASCILHQLGIPVFVDIDPDTLNIDPRKIEERITEKTRAIIPVHLHGLPADMDPINELAKKHNLAVIEDTSQSQGAVYKGKKVGSLSDIGAGSIQCTKVFASGGEGGLFTTNSAEYIEKAKLVRLFGEEEIEPGRPREYNALTMGWNYRMSELIAAFAYSQFKRFDKLVALRQKNCEHLSRRLSEIPGVEPPFIPEHSTHVYFLYPIKFKPEQLNIDIDVTAFVDTVQKVLEAEGVPVTKWQKMPVPAQSLFQEKRGFGKGYPWSCKEARKNIAYVPEEYPVTLDVISRTLFLGHEGGGLTPPNGTELAGLYADAFEKVLIDNRDEIIAMAQQCL